MISFLVSKPNKNYFKLQKLEKIKIDNNNNPENRAKIAEEGKESPMSTESEDAVRRKSAISEYRKKLLNHKELEGRVRSGFSFLKPYFSTLAFRYLIKALLC